MKDLSKEQLKLVEDLVHPEKDAFIEWYTDEFGSRHDWKLHDLRNKPKITEETIKNIKQLKSSGLTFEQIRKLIQEQETKMWDEINQEYWWIEKEDMYEAYKELNEPDANYHELGWTLRLLDSQEGIEKDKSDKLRRFEFGYKKAVERGDPMDELDDNIKEKIAKYLRGSLKKKKRKKRRRTKKKYSKKRYSPKKKKPSTKKKTKKVKKSGQRGGDSKNYEKFQKLQVLAITLGMDFFKGGMGKNSKKCEEMLGLLNNKEMINYLIKELQMKLEELKFMGKELKGEDWEELEEGEFDDFLFKKALLEFKKGDLDKLKTHFKLFKLKEEDLRQLGIDLELNEADFNNLKNVFRNFKKEGKLDQLNETLDKLRTDLNKSVGVMMQGKEKTAMTSPKKSVIKRFPLRDEDIVFAEEGSRVVGQVGGSSEDDPPRDGQESRRRLSQSSTGERLRIAGEEEEEEEEEEEVCAMCLERPPTEAFPNPECSHKFCPQCLETLMTTADRENAVAQRRARLRGIQLPPDNPAKCPICRREIFRRKKICSFIAMTLYVFGIMCLLVIIPLFHTIPMMESFGVVLTTFTWAGAALTSSGEERRTFDLFDIVMNPQQIVTRRMGAASALFFMSLFFWFAALT